MGGAEVPRKGHAGSRCGTEARRGPGAGAGLGAGAEASLIWRRTWRVAPPRPTSMGGSTTVPDDGRAGGSEARGGRDGGGEGREGGREVAGVRGAAPAAPREPRTPEPPSLASRHHPAASPSSEPRLRGPPPPSRDS